MKHTLNILFSSATSSPLTIWQFQSPQLSPRPHAAPSSSNTICDNLLNTFTVITYLLGVEYKLPSSCGTFWLTYLPQIPSESLLCSALYLRGADLFKVHSQAPGSATFDQREPGTLKLVGKVDFISSPPPLYYSPPEF